MGAAYTDPGAAASKVNPNNPSRHINLTSSVMVSGLEAISTLRPTLPGSPYIVSYDCHDKVSSQG